MADVTTGTLQSVYAGSHCNMLLPATAVCSPKEPYGNGWARYGQRDIRDFGDFFGREFAPENTRPFVSCDAEISSELRPLLIRMPGGEYRDLQAREWTGPLVEGTVHWQQPDFRPWHFTDDTRQVFCQPANYYRSTG